MHIRQRRHITDSDRIEDALQTLQIIRDEAFRCKGITEKLLSLSTPADNTRESLSLRHAVEDVFAMLQHLKRFRERDLRLENGSTANPTVMANENEIKQVLLNLMVNALEATDAHGGQVWVDIEQDDQWVRLAVNDNGQGMTPDVCQRVFEPFFSAKRSDGCRGIGLGLSISHAIVANHSGRLLAQSEGPGRGSRFTMELPLHGGHPT